MISLRISATKRHNESACCKKNTIETNKVDSCVARNNHQSWLACRAFQRCMCTQCPPYVQLLLWCMYVRNQSQNERPLDVNVRQNATIHTQTIRDCFCLTIAKQLAVEGPLTLIHFFFRSELQRTS